MVHFYKYKSLHRFLFFGLIYFGLASCDSIGQEKKTRLMHSNKPSTISYDFEHPESVYKLPSYLKEISGISYFKQDRIACVQDEKAIIYIFDTKKEEIVAEIDFGEKGDYEDIVIVNDDAYVLRSDGHLFRQKKFEKNQKKAKIIKTPLDSKNNAEGLAYDPVTQSLLIACKDSPSLKNGKSYAGYKAIYSFDLESKTLAEEPAYLIDFSKIDSTKVMGSVENLFVETAIKLKLTDGSRFYPSGIAIHPIERENIYLISSIGKLLIIMDREGRIIKIVELDRKLFNQPEGICFSENGDLYISNEGNNGGGNILKFKAISNTLKKN